MNNPHFRIEELESRLELSMLAWATTTGLIQDEAGSDCLCSSNCQTDCEGQAA